nr:hypothetical protein [Planctomycetota bacterium]
MSELVHDDKFHADAIETLAHSGANLSAGLASDSEAERAAYAITAGLRGDAAMQDALLGLADEEALAARAAGWALGQLDAEAALLAAAETGGLDLREQAYRALAGLAARGAASPAVAPAMHTRIDAELERAAKGLTSLAEHATRVLAVLGDAKTVAAIQRVVETDSLADRFELERQRKRVESDGKDSDAIRELTDWRIHFADD